MRSRLVPAEAWEGKVSYSAPNRTSPPAGGKRKSGFPFTAITSGDWGNMDVFIYFYFFKSLEACERTDVGSLETVD